MANPVINRSAKNNARLIRKIDISSARQLNLAESSSGALQKKRAGTLHEEITRLAGHLMAAFDLALSHISDTRQVDDDYRNFHFRCPRNPGEVDFIFDYLRQRETPDSYKYDLDGLRRFGRQGNCIILQVITANSPV